MCTEGLLSCARLRGLKWWTGGFLVGVEEGLLDCAPHLVRSRLVLPSED